MKYFVFYVLSLTNYWLIIQANNKPDAMRIANQLVSGVDCIDSSYAIGERLSFPAILGKKFIVTDNAWRINDLQGCALFLNS